TAASCRSLHDARPIYWDFAISSVDYLAADNAPSPVQHFWSLSVEEQFYFVWPMIIGLAFLLGMKFGRSKRIVGFTILGETDDPRSEEHTSELQSRFDL